MFKQHQPIKYLSIEKIFLLICLLFVQTAFSGNSVESTFDNDGATSWKFIEKLSPAEKQTFDAIIANTNLTKAQTESALQAWALTQNATVQVILQINSKKVEISYRQTYKTSLRFFDKNCPIISLKSHKNSKMIRRH